MVDTTVAVLRMSARANKRRRLPDRHMPVDRPNNATSTRKAPKAPAAIATHIAHVNTRSAAIETRNDTPDGMRASSGAPNALGAIDSARIADAMNGSLEPKHSAATGELNDWKNVPTPHDAT